MDIAESMCGVPEWHANHIHMPAGDMVMDVHLILLSEKRNLAFGISYDAARVSIGLGVLDINREG